MRSTDMPFLGVTSQKHVTTSDHFGAMSSKANGRSYLLAIPPDVRNIIYELVFRQIDGIHLDLDSEEPLLPSSSFALARTCRQIRDECRDLPFWLNTFHFHVPILRTPRKQCPAMYSPPPLQQYQRKLDIRPDYDLTASTQALRQTAREFVTAAMRLPHIDVMLVRLEKLIRIPSLISRMRRVHLDLGSQTDNVFIARFVSAWTQIAPILDDLFAECSAARVSFQLRVSRRLVVDWDLGKEADLEYRLVKLVDWLDIGEELTLPELSVINTVRITIQETMTKVEGKSNLA